MGEMIGRVALVIKAKLGEAMSAKPLLGDASSGDWYASDCGTIDLSEIARAAIEAMREPTKSMLAAFADGDDPAYAEDWRSLIDAALAEK